MTNTVSGKSWRALVAATFLLAGACLSRPALSAELKPAAIEAFNRYIQASEQRMDRELGSGQFLQPDTLPTSQREQAYARLRAGDLFIQSLAGRDPGTIEVPGGLVHDWAGTVFIPGTTLAETLRLLQDYDHHHAIYSPEVMGSRLLRRQGNDFQAFLRLRKKKIVTVVLDTDYDVHYFLPDPAHAYSRSYSTRIAEVEDVGEPGERDKPPGQDSGYLWRLYSYWRLQEKDGGVYVQCEAISLTRDIPAALGWIIRPFLQSIPRESLQFTLGRTRQALQGRQPQSAILAK